MEARPRKSTAKDGNDYVRERVRKYKQDQAELMQAVCGSLDYMHKSIYSYVVATLDFCKRNKPPKQKVKRK